MLLDEAAGAALEAIDAATDDEAERTTLMHLLAGSLFVGATSECDEAAQLSMAMRLTVALETEGVAWKMVRSDE